MTMDPCSQAPPDSTQTLYVCVCVCVGGGGVDGCCMCVCVHLWHWGTESADVTTDRQEMGREAVGETSGVMWWRCVWGPPQV